MTDGDWRDRRQRQRVELQATVHGPDGAQEVKVSNLSLEGCCIDGMFGIGEHFDLDLPRVGRVRGQVRWAIGGRAGIRFVTADDRPAG